MILSEDRMQAALNMQEADPMPRRDLFHDAVRNALVKDGWTITHDPYILRFGDQRLQVDSEPKRRLRRNRMDAR
jgi:hypothetical protein